MSASMWAERSNSPPPSMARKYERSFSQRKRYSTDDRYQSSHSPRSTTYSVSGAYSEDESTLNRSQISADGEIYKAVDVSPPQSIEHTLLGISVGIWLCSVAFVTSIVMSIYLYFNKQDTTTYVSQGREFPVWFTVQMAGAFGTSFILSFFCWVWTTDTARSRLFCVPFVIDTSSMLMYAQLASGHAPYMAMAFNDRRLLPSRYVTWMVTTPLMLYLYSRLSTASLAQLLTSILADVIMLASGYLASVSLPPHNGIYLFISFGTWIYVVWSINNMILNAIEDTNAEDRSYRSALNMARYFMLIGWIIMPLIWVFAALNVIDVTTEEMTYEICDFITKCGASAMLLHTSLQSKTEYNADRAQTLMIEESKNALYFLQSTLKERERFFLSMTLQVRTPLMGIINICEGMEDASKDELCQEGNMKRMQTIKMLGQLVIELVDELLSPAHHDRIKASLLVVNMEQLLGLVERIVQPVMAKGVKFTVNIEQNLPQCVASPKYCVQSLYNLLVYASTCTSMAPPSPEPSVTIECYYRPDNTSLTIQINDSGCADYPDASVMISLQTIFDRREGGSRSEAVDDGVIQSVLTARNLIINQGGVIKASFPSVGGTSFTISFPVATTLGYNGSASDIVKGGETAMAGSLTTSPFA